MRIEHIVHLEHDDADVLFNLMELHGEDEVMDELMEYHFPGEHPEYYDMLSACPHDHTYEKEIADGQYIMYFNYRLGYIGLDYIQFSN